MTIRRAALGVFVLLASLGLCGRGLADEPPSFALTTDTPAYCAQLVRQVAERRSQSLDVQRLLAEGREMCEDGEIRGGIRRLRRALVLLHHRAIRDEPPS